MRFNSRVDIFYSFLFRLAICSGFIHYFPYNNIHNSASLLNRIRYEQNEMCVCLIFISNIEKGISLYDCLIPYQTSNHYRSIIEKYNVKKKKKKYVLFDDYHASVWRVCVWMFCFIFFNRYASHLNFWEAYHDTTMTALKFSSLLLLL